MCEAKPGELPLSFIDHGDVFVCHQTISLTSRHHCEKCAQNTKLLVVSDANEGGGGVHRLWEWWLGVSAGRFGLDDGPVWWLASCSADELAGVTPTRAQARAYQGKGS